MRIAAVVQRYGTEVAGGAERLAREVVGRLAESCDVTVLTTTARDYVSWANAYPAGEQRVDGVRVQRFPVALERDPAAFDAVSERVLEEPSAATLQDELAWVRAQGPDSPELLAALWQARESYDAFLLFTYLYAPTLFGGFVLGKRAVLVPLAHNEPPIYLRVYRSLLRLPSSLLYQTPEERELVERVVPRNPVHAEVVGVGVDSPEVVEHGADCEIPRKPYALYLGRIDPSKGIAELLEGYARYREIHGGELELVLCGEASMQLEAAPGVHATGFVSEQRRNALLAQARIVVQPSRYESLSLVALEAWARARPVLAPVQSEVLAGQLQRSGGGLLYDGIDGMAAALSRAAHDDPELGVLGARGQAFVRATCSWDAVIETYRGHLERAAATRAR